MKFLLYLPHMMNQIKIILFTFSCIVLIFITSPKTNAQQEKNHILNISQQILEKELPEEKHQLNILLIQTLRQELNFNIRKINPIDSNGLIFELIDKDQKLQLISWAVSINDNWEYFGFLKSYSEIAKEYQVYELIPTNFHSTLDQSVIFDSQNWPAGVYTKMIETEHNHRKYYTLFGWLAPEKQTAFKFIEVMTLSRSGKPYFGKSKYFKKGKELSSRQLFGYFFQSRFLLDYGNYDYSTRKWNRKKKKYVSILQSDDLIVFDQLTSMYPEMADRPEFLVPVGNAIDAFKFEKGIWIYISDIDARNLKQKQRKTNAPALDLFEK